MNTKECIACRETIHAQALKCRYCQQIQTRAANLQNKPAFHYMALAVLLVMLVMLVYWIVSLGNQEPVEPEFEITGARLKTSITDNGLNVRCFAEIKNPTLLRWDDFTLQASFYNEAGETIDVLYAEPELSVYPLFSFKGMVSGEASAAEAEYAACSMTVIDADSY